MEYTKIPGLDLQVSRVALGTWAIGGWMWGGTDEMESVQTVHAALDRGVNVIDTAPVYGFGTSEKIVGKAVKEAGGRYSLAIATKAGLEWDASRNAVWRNSAPERIRKEVEDSLRRLRTEVIDVYQIHWPDPTVPIEETAGVVEQLKKEGKIQAAGVSNFEPDQMDAFRRRTELAVCQPPYNLFERDAEADVLSYCREHAVSTLTYGVLCRGLLTGKMSPETTFSGDDLRRVDPKFQEPRFSQYLEAVSRLSRFARERHGRDLIHLAVRFVLDKGAGVALWGGRHPDQMDPLLGAFGWKLTGEEMEEIDRILEETVPEPVGPEFMAPPAREGGPS